MELKEYIFYVSQPLVSLNGVRITSPKNTPQYMNSYVADTLTGVDETTKLEGMGVLVFIRK